MSLPSMVARTRRPALLRVQDFRNNFPRKSKLPLVMGENLWYKEKSNDRGCGGEEAAGAGRRGAQRRQLRRTHRPGTGSGWARGEYLRDCPRVSRGSAIRLQRAPRGFGCGGGLFQNRLTGVPAHIFPPHGVTFCVGPPRLGAVPQAFGLPREGIAPFGMPPALGRALDCRQGRVSTGILLCPKKHGGDQS